MKNELKLRLILVFEFNEIELIHRFTSMKIVPDDYSTND